MKTDEFKVINGDNDIFGIFRVSKDISVEEIGARFTNYLRAELAGESTKREKAKDLEFAIDDDTK